MRLFIDAIIDRGAHPHGGRMYSVMLDDGRVCPVRRSGRPDTASGRDFREVMPPNHHDATPPLWAGQEADLLVMAYGAPVLNDDATPYPYPKEYRPRHSEALAAV